MVIQVNIWKCEICHRIETTSEEVVPYGDPVIVLPNGEEWEYIEIDGKELFSCPACFKKSQPDS